MSGAGRVKLVLKLAVVLYCFEQLIANSQLMVVSALCLLH